MASMTMRVLCVIVACMVVVAPFAEAITCSDVTSKLAPCLNYLKSGGKVSKACCNGVKGVKSAAKTTSAKKTACNCIKSAYKSYSGINATNASGLPKKCGVNIKISLSTDCNKVK